MPLVGLLGAYALGIIIARSVPVAPSLWLLLAGVGLLGGWMHKPGWSGSALLLALLALGGWRYTDQTAYRGNHLYHYSFAEQQDTIRAMVVQSERNVRGEQKLTLDKVHLLRRGEWQRYAGRVLLTYRSLTPRFEYGEVIWFIAILRQPAGRRNPGEFDYRRYLHMHRIFALAYLDSSEAPRIVKRSGWMIRRWASRTKLYIERLVEATTDPAAAAILKALLVGMKGEIEPDVIQEFVNTGVIHVLAVSGLHVGYVTLVILLILGFLRLPQRPRTVAAILGLFFYALMVDLRPSVTRAVLMASLVLISQGWELRLNVYNSIAAAALIQTLFNPLQLFDMGFQLSFLAVLSIVYIYRQLDGMIPSKVKTSIQDRKLFWNVYQLFLVSLAALLGTLPITVYYFQRIPLIALFANLLVVPLVGVICALGFAQVLLGSIWYWCGLAYGAVEEFLIKGLLFLMQASSKLTWASVNVPAITLWQVGLGYLILALGLHSKMRKIRFILVVLLLAGLNYWVWWPIWQAPVLRVVFLDVGQGDAILLQLPDGKNVLVDAGDRTFRRDCGALVVEPYLRRQGIRRLHYLVLTHPHSDHIGGAPYILRHIPVDTLCISPRIGKSQLVEEIQQLVDSLSIPQRLLHAGDYFNFQGGTIFVLHPSEGFCRGNYAGYNDYSIVLKVVYRNQALLLCGDIEATAERYLLGYADFLQSPLIKVPHHGSSTSSTQAFLEQVRPELAVISVGVKNKFGHPDSATIARYRALQATIHRTDERGALLLQLKPNRWRVCPWD